LPPQFGKVFISVDVANADGAPESRKKAFYDYIIQKTPATIAVEFIDPQFLYTKVNTTVYYDVNNTIKSTADIETSAKAAISQYNNDSLGNFKKTLYFSRLAELIDASDGSILSNDTSLNFVPILLLTKLSTKAFAPLSEQISSLPTKVFVRSDTDSSG